ncbi:peptidoglycan DD-metalloendopeptidase family protein [Clostridium cibarium]|uniref:Peptidoglycan DD-metalloendopeptidase family protein n=1 Tax=Clostridium cibarium TaxID=2762247 RepID=A0ABR8PWT8_9CLOT|nr:peptidoglycan DD-metalloendopeptidase family protein [Clostridium cibarium]MBD7912594.1 peptidoglycan DD-metalloendopeptidase family protein [Clostridium cibarium]
MNKKLIKILKVTLTSIGISLVFTNYFINKDENLMVSNLLCENNDINVDLQNDTSKDDKEIASIGKQGSLLNMIIKNNNYGVISSEEEGKKVLEKIGKAYIDKNNIDKGNILDVNVKTNVEYSKCFKEVTSVDSVDAIAKRIVDDNDNKNIVEVDLKCKEIRKEEIKPSVKTINRDDMYIGQVKKEDGAVGYREVVSKVSYTNGRKIGEEVLEEKTLVPSKDNIIYKGCKSPIPDKVAFLEHPTRGGTITSVFGERWGKKHNGIDIAHKSGDPVYCAFDGIVKECGYVSGYGNKILIEHEGNIQTVYAHLSSFETRIGAQVKKGDIIGRVGSTGNSTGPHLHFEVRANGVPIDPQCYIRV